MKPNLTNNLFCSSFGHNYFRVKKVNDSFSRLICKSCKKHFISKTNGEILDITFEDSNSVSLVQYI